MAMLVTSKLNEALCWLREEFHEILTDIDFEKSEFNLNELCKMINNKIKNSLNNINHMSSICDEKFLEDKEKQECIDNKDIISWNNLNYSVFHYVNIYNKIHEVLFIEEDDFYYNYDEHNVYVRKKFSPNLLFHPLIYTIDCAYFNFLLSFISERKSSDSSFCFLPKEELKTNESINCGDDTKCCQDVINNHPFGNYNFKESEHSHNLHTQKNSPEQAIIKKRKKKITYIYDNDYNFKQNFIITKEEYANICKEFSKVYDIKKYIDDQSDELYNFDRKERCAGKVDNTNGGK